jgi:uncharacterized repeat protein (TIGR03803 family)
MVWPKKIEIKSAQWMANRRGICCRTVLFRRLYFSSSPLRGLVEDEAGNLYGTTFFGGAYTNGVVFKLDRSRSETPLSCRCKQFVKALSRVGGWPRFLISRASPTSWVPSPSHSVVLCEGRESGMPAPKGFDRAAHNKSSAGSIATHGCKKRKDGAPLSGNGADENRQRWPRRHAPYKVQHQPVKSTLVDIRRPRK